MSNREPLFWNPVPWRYEKGTIWDASGDSVLETSPDGRPYVEPDVGEAIVTAVNLHFGGSMSFASNGATDEPTAIFIAHWPGKDVAVCLNHLEKLQQVGAVMGFSISATQCEPTVCANCQNETKHKQQI